MLVSITNVFFNETSRSFLEKKGQSKETLLFHQIRNEDLLDLIIKF
ncbi:hypothetical protein M899_2652 [Bacteriovorax sp. BSW11_IV]|nr:hypothetical protein M899_2652 [Bacteriovorax sp. BSW11_IV]